MVLTIIAGAILAAAVLFARGRRLLQVLFLLTTAIASIEHLGGYLGLETAAGQLPHIFVTLSVLLALAAATVRSGPWKLGGSGLGIRLYLTFVIYCAVQQIIPLTIWSVSNQPMVFYIRDLTFLIFPLLIYVLTYQVLRHRADLQAYIARRSVPLICAGIIFFSAVAVGFGRPLWAPDYIGTVRFVGGMGWSGMAYLTLPLVIIGASNFLETRRITPNALFWIALPFILFTMAISRTAFMALVAGLAVMILVWSGRVSRRWLVYAVVVVGAIGMVIFVLPTLIDRTFNDNGEILWSGRSRAADYLTSMVDRTSPLHFFFGNGLGVARGITEDLTRYGAEVRSRYLVFYWDVGIFGLGLYMAAVLALVWDSIAAYRFLARKFDAETAFVPRVLSLSAVGIAVAFLALGTFDNLNIVGVMSIYFVMMAAGRRAACDLGEQLPEKSPIKVPTRRSRLAPPGTRTRPLLARRVSSHQRP